MWYTPDVTTGLDSGCDQDLILYGEGRWGQEGPTPFLDSFSHLASRMPIPGYLSTHGSNINASQVTRRSLETLSVPAFSPGPGLAGVAVREACSSIRLRVGRDWLVWALQVVTYATGVHGRGQGTRDCPATRGATGAQLTAPPRPCTVP